MLVTLTDSLSSTHEIPTVDWPDDTSITELKQFVAQHRSCQADMSFLYVGVVLPDHCILREIFDIARQTQIPSISLHYILKDTKPYFGSSSDPAFLPNLSAHTRIPRMPSWDNLQINRNAPQPVPAAGPAPAHLPLQENRELRIFQINVSLSTIAKFILFVFLFASDTDVTSLFLCALSFIVIKVVAGFVQGWWQNAQERAEPQEPTSPQYARPVNRTFPWNIIESFERFVFGLVASLSPSWTPRQVPRRMF